MKISVVIQTLNSEKFLERVLQSVKAFDEIVICDMYSTDKTIEIAERYNCKSYFMKNQLLWTCPKLCHTGSQSWMGVGGWLRRNRSGRIEEIFIRIYPIPGHIERHLDSPQKLSDGEIHARWLSGLHPAFFRKEGSYWPPYVHSVPNVQGKTIRIPKQRKDLAFIHLINNPLELRLTKLNTYTTKEITKRANHNFPLGAIFYAPAYRFFKAYILKGGFKDGKAGLVNAGMDAFYKFTTIAKIWESRVNPEDIDPDLRT